jgi:hypothetical protein
MSLPLLLPQCCIPCHAVADIHRLLLMTLFNMWPPLPSCPTPSLLMVAGLNQLLLSLPLLLLPALLLLLLPLLLLPPLLLLLLPPPPPRGSAGSSPSGHPQAWEETCTKWQGANYKELLEVLEMPSP